MLIHHPEKQTAQATKLTAASTGLTAFLQNNLLLDYISDAVIFTDLQFRVAYFNKKAEQIYGISSTEIIGRTLGDYIRYQYINDSRESALQQFREKGKWQGKVIYTRYDLEDVYLLATVVYAHDAVGNQVGIVATLKDITSEELISQKVRQYERQMEEELLKNKIAQQNEINRVMIQTQESERNELGRELHDNINQILAVINLQLEYALENYNEEKQTFEMCKALIENVIREIRHLSHRLVLPRFAENSLQIELQKMINTIDQKQPVTLEAGSLHEQCIPDNIKETLYRIIQEQLNNIIKHAKAGQATITLQNSQHEVSLQIKDNGQGFNLSESRNGVGITNILNRVASYNGSARILSAPGEGCKILVSIPLVEQK